MISNQEDDEFVAVRVQDPRMQNEGSWNSYVDYKIFLHTNSKAFTAKTSCVRRRYSEFEWLKKKLQKNAGLVPVPDLPGKSFFSFTNEDFLERRRKGLQAFLDSVVNMTVCLSDSQLHLFLQTQLPVGHIQDCVQGHTPYTVTEAILTYASSNRGLAQAQEDDSIKEPSLTVSYESMESPAPHQPCQQPRETFRPELLSCADPDPLEGLLELCDKDTDDFQHKEKSSVKVLQKDNHLEAVVEDCGATGATFFLGESQNVPESLSLGAETQQRSCCQIQTPVEVHSPMGADFEENKVESSNEESIVTIDTEEKTVPHSDTKADQKESPEEAKIEMVDIEPETSANSALILDSTDREFREQGTESEAGSQEEVLEVVCSEKQVLGNHVNGLKKVGSSADHVEDVSCPEEAKSSDGQKESDNAKSDESESKDEKPLESEIHEETHNMSSVPEAESCDDGIVEQMDQVKQEADQVGTKDDSDEDSHSSSNESIVKVSDEESICDEAEDSVLAADGYMKTSPEEESPSRNILHMNGCLEVKEDISAQEDEDLQYISDISDFSKSLELHSTVTGGDLTENSDISVLESSCTPGLSESKCTEQETLSLLSLDASEETHEVEVH
ncbi:sorting nexin-11 [Plectropomus leopardus]|uniref:sorting nexin-11 n=1 Tax=Plectropomus leopardus TaxID=160734 RepID=UPI001C4BFC01|nr:sorting nexin-11 [Plectropomus leopardus]